MVKRPSPPQPDTIPEFPIKAPWLGFTKSLRVLLVVQPDDRLLDQYIPLRDHVLMLVESQDFLRELHSAWATAFVSGNYFVPGSELIGDAIRMELQSFSQASEVAQATQVPDVASKERKKLIGRGSTTVGSIKDLLEQIGDMNLFLKGGLTLLKELLDFFKS